MSDEATSLLMDNGHSPEATLEDIKKAIAKCQMQHEQLIKEQKQLSKVKEQQHDLTLKFKHRTDKLLASLEEDQCSNAKDIEVEKEKRAALQKKESLLKKEVDVAEGKLSELEELVGSLRQQTEVGMPVPEREVVFADEKGTATNTQNFDMKAHILYPMEEGTALITFEEADVAENILRLVKHTVKLDGEGECVTALTLEAKPVHLMLPTCVQMDTHVSPRRILVSNLPEMDADVLLDKLDIHFSKSRNNGGEVDSKELLDDSGHVVITFLDASVSKRLTDQQYHDVDFGKGKTHRVRVTPFLNGEITNFQTKMLKCSRTVLLTGIPTIMDQENLQDILEIHFQKASNGGGEVDAIRYNPQGQQTMAMFMDYVPSPPSAD